LKSLNAFSLQFRFLHSEVIRSVKYLSDFFKQELSLALFPEQTGYHKREKEMRPRAASDIYAIISQVQGTWRTGFQRLDKIKSRT